LLFQTLEFLSLFILVIPLNLLLKGSWRKALLLLASYVFYGWFSIPLISLMVFSTVLDYAVARRITSTKAPTRRRLWLSLSLVGNLGVLFLFKYTNWLMGSMNSLAHFFTGQDPFPLYDIILPLGVSFYTFQTLSYTIDIYRGKIEKPTDLLTFALFVSFFPQLVAGPIVRAAHLIPQLRRGPTFPEGRVIRSVSLVVFGLFKKVVIADSLAQIVDWVYLDPSAFSGLHVLLATYAFAFQIYCDFSGYTDMARGLGGLLGFDLGENFRQPYFSSSIREFWRRWHISLSTWLRDYLYIPLGGNRGGVWFVLRNVMLTMLLGGLWHGANWTFVAWGGIHGAWISLERILARTGGAARRRLPFVVRGLLILATFHGVCVTWVFFRAGSFSDAMKVFASVTRESSVVGLRLELLLWIPVAILIDALVIRKSVRDFVLRHPLAHWTLLWLAVLSMIVFGVSGANKFIYFQF
jgi:alginate O-acetyltransferase complex protein AlgI